MPWQSASPLHNETAPAPTINRRHVRTLTRYARLRADNAMAPLAFARRRRPVAEDRTKTMSWFQFNAVQHGDALTLLRSLPISCTPLVFFDPQYRGSWTS